MSPALPCRCLPRHAATLPRDDALQGARAAPLSRRQRRAGAPALFSTPHLRVFCRHAAHQPTAYHHLAVCRRHAVVALPLRPISVCRSVSQSFASMKSAYAAILESRKR